MASDVEAEQSWTDTSRPCLSQHNGVVSHYSSQSRSQTGRVVVDGQLGVSCLWPAS